MKEMYVLIELTCGMPIVRGITENEKYVSYWRRLKPQNLAVKRRVVETREDWYEITDNRWYQLWKRWKLS